MLELISVSEKQKELISKLELKDISQVYEGKDNHCRCGCGGEYISTSFMENPRNEVNDDKVMELLKKVKSSINAGISYSVSTNHLNVSYENNRAICLYFDEVKKN